MLFIHIIFLLDLILKDDLDIQKNKADLISLGKMARSIVHEINNPVSVLLSFSKKLNREFKNYVSLTDVNSHDPISVNKINELVSNINITTEKIFNIVKFTQLYLVQNKKIPKETFNLIDVLNTMKIFVKDKLCNSNIDLIIDIKNNSKLYASEIQIFQVFLNLTLNAIDAIKDLNCDKWIKISVITNNSVNGLWISYKDCGTKPSSYITINMFEESFTTKNHSGHGVGLDFIKNVIEEHDGDIFCNEGSMQTEFIIKLPVLIPAENEFKSNISAIHFPISSQKIGK